MNTNETKTADDLAAEQQVQKPEHQQDDDNDFPLGKACDLSGEGECEACQ